MSAEVWPVVIYPDPKLTTPCVHVGIFGDELKALTEAMFATMYKFKGVGLAANQIGVNLRVAVIDLKQDVDTKFVMINPKILKRVGVQRGREGCLSVPGIFDEDRERAMTIYVSYLDLRGEPVTRRATHLLARAIQHECDHLDGKLCLDQEYLDEFVRANKPLSSGQ